MKSLKFIGTSFLKQSTQRICPLGMFINTCAIMRDDMSEIVLRIEYEFDGVADSLEKNRCYVLYLGGEKVGEICFIENDKYEWEYFGDNLTYREQGQIASHIQTQI